MKIGFHVSDDQETDDTEIGYADTSPVEEKWYSQLPEFAYESTLKFWLIYGMYSSIRDFVRSIL